MTNSNVLRYEFRVNGHTLLGPVPPGTNLAMAKASAAVMAVTRRATVTVVRVSHWRGSTVCHYTKVATFDQGGRLSANQIKQGGRY